MFRKLKKRETGFTIIEVLIVLAIAGLIMLIVFLAVPALQRNARNTKIRNDASSLLSGVNEFSTNNNGQRPTSVAFVSGSTTDVQFSGATGTSPVVAKVSSGTTVSLQTRTSGSGTASTSAANVVIVVNNGCTNNALTYKARAVAASYNVESGGTGTGLAVQCLES